MIDQINHDEIPDQWKEILKELVVVALESEAGVEIDAGCNGEGPLAKAMVSLGMAKDLNEATNKIYEGRDMEGFIGS